MSGDAQHDLRADGRAGWQNIRDQNAVFGDSFAPVAHSHTDTMRMGAAASAKARTGQGARTVPNGGPVRVEMAATEADKIRCPLPP